MGMRVGNRFKVNMGGWSMYGGNDGQQMQKVGWNGWIYVCVEGGSVGSGEREFYRA